MADLQSTAGESQSEISAEYDAVIVGAGFAGLYMLHRLRGLGLRRACSRPATTSAAPGTGTAIPARAATSRAWTTPTRSPTSCSRSGTWTRALRRAAGDPALPQPRRRPLRPAPRHPVQHARHRRALRRGGEPLDRSSTDTGRARLRAVLHHGDRLPLGAADRPTSRASRRSRASGITPAAGRTRASTSPASAWASSAPAPRRSSRSRVIAEQAGARCTSSSARRTSACRPTTRRSTRSTSGRSRRTTPSTARRARESRVRLRRSPIANPRSRRWRSPPRSARREFEARWQQRRLRLHCGASPTCSSTRRPTTPPPSSSAARSARSCTIPTVAEMLAPRGLPDRHQAPLRRHRLLRDLQPRQRHARRPAQRRRSRRSRRRACAPTAPSTSSTPRLRHRLRRDDRRAARASTSAAAAALR